MTEMESSIGTMPQESRHPGKDAKLDHVIHLNHVNHQNMGELQL